MKEVVVYAILIMGMSVWLILTVGAFVYLITKLQCMYYKWRLDRLIKKELNHAQN